MSDIASAIMEWDSLESTQSTFTEMGFNEADIRDGNLLVKLDKTENIFLKVIIQEKLEALPNDFSTTIHYQFLIENFEKFRFTKIDYVTGKKPKTLKIEFKKDDMDDEIIDKLNNCIKPDDIPAFNKLFEKGELKGIVDNLKKALNDSIIGYSEKELIAIGNVLNLHSLGIEKKIKDKKKEKQRQDTIKSAAKRVLLVIASAAMFHARLDKHLGRMKPQIDSYNGKKFKGKWPPTKLDDCVNADNVIKTLLDSWRLILAIDYKPIFETGRIVLLSNIDGADGRFNDSTKNIVGWSQQSVRVVSGLKHDILGRLFHIMLGDARYDGSFYTSVPAAVILSGLAIQNRDDVAPELKDMRIIDPSCGTGTLLMAATERIRDIMGEKYDSKIMIEKVLTGLDINVTALHMAATTLGLLSPTTRFQKMNIMQSPFGELEDGTISAGSLELYGKGNVFPIYDWSDNTASTQIDTKKSKPSRTYAKMADLVMMNPPFTRSDLRHDQLGSKLEKKVKAREAEIFSSVQAVTHSSSGPMFIVLAEHLVKDGGTVAMVLPLTASMNASTLLVRKFLAERFHIEYIVVSHDPKRVFFSENTTISEMLLILRKKKEKSPTKLIQLAINPNDTTNATELVSHILNDDIKYGYIVEIARENIINGDWSAVQFYSHHLYSEFIKIRTGKMFPCTIMGKVASFLPRGGVAARDYFKKTDKKSDNTKPTMWYNKSTYLKCIKNKPDSSMIAKTGKAEIANRAWGYRSHLLLPHKLRTNVMHVSAVYSSEPVIGSAWMSVTGHRDIGNEYDSTNTDWEKAMSLYLNSTIGIIATLGARTPTIMSYPRFSIDNMSNITVPKLDKVMIKCLAKIHDDYATKKIGTLKEHNDLVRMAIDKEVCEVLNINQERVDRIRLELSREPMCTDKRYKPDPPVKPAKS